MTREALQNYFRISVIGFFFAWFLCYSPMPLFCEEKEPVRIGLTAEFGLQNSFSAQAVEMGIRVAINEINDRGGVLGGRPLILEIKDDRSVPARAIQNVKDFNAMKDMTAVFGARFSPVLIELIPVVHDIGMILLNPWGSADGITDHNRKPSYSFRLSLKDSFAMPAMLNFAKKRNLTSIGLLLPNTSWGRSNIHAAESYVAANPSIKLVNSRWYNWGDSTMIALYEDILSANAQAVILVANDREGSILIKEMAALPEEKRLPIFSHWGVTGGRFFEAVKEELKQLDFSVIQTFSFFKADSEMRDRFMTVARKLYPVKNYEDIEAPVGVGHAYDLTHLIAQAIEKAKTTNRVEIRSALEQLGPYRGLTASFDRPFTPDNHDALGPEAIFMAKYRDDGVLIPIPADK